ncbi:MAG TPA: 30S ribosomal protein S3 [Candidatus Wildermuthbacteria bacterium]|uniref:30S ribosomal protein S3 n=1 Tax=uncultured organism TaxID=155900 RepID=U3GVS1_9ZZZZ|nr:30S ribosomal protein S3 [uncultured organism]KKW04563.1 MAG: 30S ribosomal protein S3 [Parcubacteria group bacterium GW2011_GWB1_49_12]KKW09179.1 MAG: 30S ribosomal protein S3 [Parcubacteria group bacterium GW2011_GWA1_49_26]KKW13486.1 MAG: 30S ribosomal protein S3 [Parcubacteria group bacterium GW2011_GWA2_50_10]OHA61432.1 MAG: 30S ribosomal protein S3 [Candidatus Wildermuthbacteria bacterium GWA1_49_26]OHA66225.1 MAG: 30S ribosomal protein S3 [Candidatus Wildermuthbacteria bacterium RIFC
MAHKVHPKVFRIKETADWQSRWFEKTAYQEALREDFLIRSYIEKNAKDAGIASIEIERFAGNISIIINTSRPGLLIGRGGSGIEELRKAIVKILESDKKRRYRVIKDTRKREIRLEIREVKNPWNSASLTAQWIAQQLEKRMPYRRAMKQALAKVMANKGIEGAKLEISGRLGGADIARRETLKVGRLPLQTLRAQIDYALREAKTTYGMIGVKVWMYKGEKFD